MKSFYFILLSNILNLNIFLKVLINTQQLTFIIILPDISEKWVHFHVEIKEFQKPVLLHFSVNSKVIYSYVRLMRYWKIQ